MRLGRIVVALIFIPLLLLAVILRGPFLLAMVLLGTGAAAAEFSLMFHRRGVAVPVVATVLVAWAYVWATADHVSLWPWLGAALGVGLLGSLLQRASLRERAQNLVLAVVGGTYLGLLMRYALLIGELPKGDAWGVLVLLGVWGADTGAFVAGGRFGRRLLVPAISPSKTWEGVAGGLLLAIGAVALLSALLPISPLHVVPLGCAITGAAVLGDLVESSVKRLARVKDAGHLLGEHGGFLDRMDSLLLVLPVVYGYATLFAR